MTMLPSSQVAAVVPEERRHCANLKVPLVTRTSLDSQHGRRLPSVTLPLKGMHSPLQSSATVGSSPVKGAGVSGSV